MRRPLGRATPMVLATLVLALGGAACSQDGL
jgi:hypothetical protein